MLSSEIHKLSETEVEKKLQKLTKRLERTPLYLMRNWLLFFTISFLGLYLILGNTSYRSEPNGTVALFAITFIVSLVLAMVVSACIDMYLARLANKLVDRRNFLKRSRGEPLKMSDLMYLRLTF